MSEQTTAGDARNELSMPEFLARLDEGVPTLVVDVRNADEFAAWNVDAARPYESVHVPYFDFLEDPEGATAKVPKTDSQIVVLCAKGGSSEFVAGVLREAGLPALNVAGGMEAYGEHLQSIRVPLLPEEEGRFEIWQLNRRGKGCLSYVVRSGDEAVVIDPSRHVERYEQFVAGLGAKIVRILDTHVHADHLSGGPELAQRTGAPFFVTAGEGMTVQLPITPLEDGEEIRLGGEGGVTLSARVVATPGHTPGSTSYLVNGRYLLSGDTLFVKGVGRPDLGGQVDAWGRALFHTLRQRISQLPGDTVVLPAHYGCRSEISEDGVVKAELGVLRKVAPEFGIPTEELFVEAMRAGVKTPPETYADIVKANLGLLEVTPEKAAVWEFGKNECAASAARKENAR